jgi:hypothetical protein
MSQLLLRTYQCILFRRPRRQSRHSPTSFTALLASNLLAQFFRQIVILILGLESPKVCGNLAVCLVYHSLDTYLFLLLIEIVNDHTNEQVESEK